MMRSIGRRVSPDRVSAEMVRGVSAGWDFFFMA